MHAQRCCDWWCLCCATLSREADPAPTAPLPLRSYWGGGSEAAIFHWHGPKPARCLPCYLPRRHQPDWAEQCEALHQRDIARGLSQEHQLPNNCWPAYVKLLNTCPDGGDLYAAMVAEFQAYQQVGGAGEEVQGIAAVGAAGGRQGPGVARAAEPAERTAAAGAALSLQGAAAGVAPLGDSEQLQQQVVAAGGGAWQPGVPSIQGAGGGLPQRLGVGGGSTDDGALPDA